MTTYRYATPSEQDRARNAAPPCDACGERPAGFVEIIAEPVGAFSGGPSEDREARLCFLCTDDGSLSRRELNLQDLDNIDRRAEWIERRSAALDELQRLTAIARRNADTSREWLDVFETLSALATNYRLDHANVCATRPVWHAPAEWVDVDLRQDPDHRTRYLAFADEG